MRSPHSLPARSCISWLPHRAHVPVSSRTACTSSVTYTGLEISSTRRGGDRAFARPHRLLPYVSDHRPVQPNDGDASDADIPFHASYVCGLRRLPRPYRARNTSAGHLHAHRHALAAPHPPPMPVLRCGRPRGRRRGQRALLTWSAGVAGVSPRCSSARNPLLRFQMLVTSWPYLLKTRIWPPMCGGCMWQI
jgi:hypothetical protein